jgi:hypothetical protein
MPLVELGCHYRKEIDLDRDKWVLISKETAGASRRNELNAQ